MKLPTPGIHRSVPRPEYERIDALNWSLLKHMQRSAAHFRAAQLNRDEEDTDAKKVGRAVHVATLEPERFRAQYVVWDGGRRYGKEWDKFCAQHAGFEILTEEQYQTVTAISQAALTHEHAAKYLRGGSAEATLLWAEERHGVPCKGRVDFTGKALVDLKTTRDASPEAFAKQCHNLSYAAQAAYYQDGYAAAAGGEVLPVVLIAVENTAPHIVQVYRVPDAILSRGRDMYRSLLDQVVACREKNDWPGYADGELELELPGWVQRAEDEDVSGLGLDFTPEEAPHA